MTIPNTIKSTPGPAIREEQKTVEAMIRIYCRELHNTKGNNSCAVCEELIQYAHTRLDKCVFGEEKPVCAKCPVHCYQSEQRRAITTVMRYSGPKMLFKHPYLAIKHLLKELKAPSEKVKAIQRRKEDLERT